MVQATIQALLPRRTHLGEGIEKDEAPKPCGGGRRPRSMVIRRREVNLGSAFIQLGQGSKLRRSRPLVHPKPPIRAMQKASGT